MRVALISIVFVALALAAVASVSGAKADEPKDQMTIAREMVKMLEAYAVYKMGQYELAFERFQALANNGHTGGMYNLANLYAEGLGVEQSDRKAFEWYLKAARKGNQLSMEALAEALDAGRGVAPDPERAAHWRNMARDVLIE